MKVLSIQSSVSYGHVGNAAAVFPLQRLGVEVMPVYTVCFSNHTGYGSWRGPLLTGDDVREIVTGIDERGGLADVDVVLSGYQGGNDIGDAILDAVALVKERNPRAIYSCDPVLGNAVSGCHVAPEVQELIRDRVVQHADLLTPNQFELGFITETTPTDLDSTLASIDRVFEIGPQAILVTSVERPDRPEGTIEMIAANRSGAWLVRTPRLEGKWNGSGDVTAALYAAHLTRSGDPALALSRTTASVYELLERTLAAGTRELQLIAAQESYVHPNERFEVTQVR